uniref:major histocompatibility complex class I-related gene protein-like n=1 Tax=Podarcis muralis TaxID=64176 RepID=UPI00109FF118|nr:major histocompatibility complex class I-related gene protein-like [Podarcis muralis]
MESRLHRRCVLILVATADFLLRGCAGSSFHKFQLIYISVSEPDQTMPKFTALGYADDQLVTRFDSNTEEGAPQVSWAKKLKEDIHEYWDRYTKVLEDSERWFENYHRIIRQYYNHSKGFHTWQMMVGSEVSPHGSNEAYWTFGYDGRDFLSLDKEADAWIAADAVAQVIERMWEADSSMIPRFKFLVEVVFIEWLQKYEAYAKEALLRKEPPVVKVTRKPNNDGMETLICRAHGFYPKEINSTWRKDGETSGQDTVHGGILPNSDGTYYNWLSIKINPKDRNHYWCHVEHIGLQKPMDVPSEEPGSHVGIIIGCILSGIFLLVAVSVGIYVHITKKQGSGSSSGV